VPWGWVHDVFAVVIWIQFYGVARISVGASEGREIPHHVSTLTRTGKALVANKIYRGGQGYRLQVNGLGALIRHPKTYQIG
jgi:hypothetical protein